MSELDVIVIHIRAEQAAEYERLFAERELPRWREYKERGAFISARIFRAAFGTDPRQDIAKYVIAVEVPATPSTASTTLIPGSRSSTGSPTHSSRRLRWCTADRCCTLSDRHSASASGAGVPQCGPPGAPADEAGRQCDTRPELRPTGTAAQSGRWWPAARADYRT